MDPVTQSKTIGEFKAHLSKTGWFLNIGQPCDNSYVIKDWDEWSGPEVPSSLSLATWAQELHDRIFSLSGDREGELKKLWDDIHEIVLKSARANINGDTDQDA